MKIAILVRAETADKCIGKGCLNAFYQRKDAFETYDESVEMVAFTHHGGDLEHKIERFKENGVEVVHLSSCMRSKYPDYEKLALALSKDFKVVGYTHGSSEGKEQKTMNLEKAD